MSMDRTAGVSPDCIAAWAQRCGSAVGGAPLEPVARAGPPAMKRLQPLSPDTRKT
jgi:hypothetical protein